MNIPTHMKISYADNGRLNCVDPLRNVESLKGILVQRHGGGFYAVPVEASFKTALQQMFPFRKGRDLWLRQIAGNTPTAHLPSVLRCAILNKMMEHLTLG